MADPKQAIALTLKHEGGYQNDPDDPGNWTGGVKGVGEQKGTKFGISAHEFPDLDIVNLTEDQAIDIYQHGRPPKIQSYWNPLFTQIQDQGIANKLEDLSVLFGQGTAIKAIQGLVSMVEDGVFGPHTLVAVNEAGVNPAQFEKCGYSMPEEVNGVLTLVFHPCPLLQAYKIAMVNKAISDAAANPGERKDLPGWISRINS